MLDILVKRAQSRRIRAEGAIGVADFGEAISDRRTKRRDNGSDRTVRARRPPRRPVTGIGTSNPRPNDADITTNQRTEIMDVAGYTRLLRRWAWLIVLCPLIAALGASVISRQITPVYEADATVLVKPAQPLNIDTGQSQTGVSSTSDQITATYVQLMTQPSLLSKVISDLHLQMTPQSLAGKVKVTPQTNTTVIKVSVQDKSPAQASRIANQLVQDFGASQSQLRQQQASSYTNSLQTQAQQLQGKLSGEQGSIQDLQRQASKAQLSQPDQDRLTSLQQQSANDSVQLQNVNSQLAEIQAQTALNSDSVVVISAATEPGSPVSPNIPLNILFAAIGGLVLALAIVLIVQRLDQTIKDDSELQRRTELTPLGHIPFTSASKTRMGELVVLGGQPSAAEAYRGLRTNLLFASVDRQVKTIVVTSPGPGDGKSRTAANLAIVLAAAGHTTLLVDADFRRPSLHGFFGKASKRGLSELILAEHPEDGDLIREVGEVPRLWLLAAGSSPPNPSELLGSTRVETLLGELASRVDYVVLDTPPLHAVTDPALVAARADATLLVVEQERTTYGAAVNAKQQLDNVGARVLGVVVNKVRARSGKYGYSSYRYYGPSQPASTNGSEVPGSRERAYPSTDAH